MSWGYKIILVFAVFASMIGYMVYRSFGTHFELVEPEYYKSELKYQHVIEGTNRAYSLSTSPTIKQDGNDIVLQLPGEMKNAAVSGAVLFYCAYDSRKDKRINLQVDKNGRQSFGNIITPGVYNVKIDWRKGDEDYFSESQIKVY